MVYLSVLIRHIIIHIFLFPNFKYIFANSIYYIYIFLNKLMLQDFKENISLYKCRNTSNIY